MERALDLLSASFPILHSFFIRFFLFVSGISSNVALLAAAFYRTPKSLKSYSVMIKAGALNDIAAICIDLFTMNRILGIPGNMFYIVSTGPCSLIAPQACYYAYCFLVASILYSIYAMAASFAFRLWVLHRQSPTSGNVLAIMISLFILPTAAMYIFTFDQGNVENVREIVNASFPECLSEKGALTGQSGMTPLSMLVVAYAAATSGPAYAACLVCRKMILNFLRKQSSMSERTLKMHSCLIKALTVHAMIPPIYLLALLCYVVMFLGIYRQAAMEKAIFLMSTLPSIMAPLCSLYYVDPYRHFVSRRFRSISFSSEASSTTFATNAHRKISGK